MSLCGRSRYYRFVAVRLRWRETEALLWLLRAGGTGMSDRLLVNLTADGQASVGVWLGGEIPHYGESFRLAWPLDDNALEDLRWYLEDYLWRPFGVYEERGPQVEARLTEWGREIFAALFGSGAARDAYVRMRASRGPVEIVFHSGSTELLGLPWELMADPARPTPLALDVAGISRSLPTADLANTIDVPGGRLRVLMVISRPAGTTDVGYRMIARPLLQRLEAVRGQVDLMVLRPPTLDALNQVLAAAVQSGDPFQVVHFDGHGILAGRRPSRGPAPHMFQGAGPEGVLVFEKPDGGAEEIPASRVAQVLAEGQVPVVVLNACQSGAVGKELEAAVATRLLQEGVASVVAMAYAVYAVAAAEFMAAFYERLFAGETITAAVTAGRRRLFQHDRRPSIKGDMPLADWVVPVHYLRRDVSFPQARVERAGEITLDAALDQLEMPAADGARFADLKAVGSFFGRDDLFYQLEIAARLQKVVVLHGPAGTGKTEVAKAFGRWWRDTGGVEDPAWVCWHSFEPGEAAFSLDGVITTIGLQRFGSEFLLRDASERRALVLQELDERRMLLIWDNFETVHSMPDPSGVAMPLDEKGCREMQEFLGHVAKLGHSTVIITSRTTEDWLGNIRRIPVGELAAHEAAEYAGYLLAPYPAAAPRRNLPAFGELFEWLDGHPLCMRLVLPHLDTTEPEALLAGLRGSGPLPVGNGTQGSRTTSLSASIKYSFSHLAESTRQLLPAICLLEGVADVGALTRFSQIPVVPERFGTATEQVWRAALDDAAQVGLLTKLDIDMYKIHPALTAFLAGQWRSEEPEDHDLVRDIATHALLSAHAVYGEWLFQQIESGRARSAYTKLGLQHRTFGRLLGYALAHGLWDEARAITVALDQYWRSRDLEQEANAWADRVRLATEANGNAPEPGSAAGRLWLSFVGIEGNWQLESGRLVDADRTYQQVVATLQTEPTSPEQQKRLASSYHQLSTTARARGRMDEAEDWSLRSLAIKEKLGNRLGMANSYAQLGIVAMQRGQLEKAKEWLLKALDLHEKLSNQSGMAIAYYHIGIVTQEQGRLDEAEEWHRKALVIDEELGNQSEMAMSYAELGIVAMQRGQLDEAKEWHLKALTIFESLKNKPRLALGYFQLGMSARLQGRLHEAEEWYRKSLTIDEELGNQPGMVYSYVELGNTAAQEGRLDAAKQWFQKSLAINEELGNRPGMAISYGELGGVALQWSHLDEAEDWYRKSLAISQELASPRNIAYAFGGLGMVAQDREQLDEAEDWYRKSLTIHKDIGNEARVAEGYYRLGEVTRKREHLGEAEDWYRKSLAINQELDNRPGMASTFAGLGKVAQERGQLDEAEDWYRKSLAIGQELDNRPAMAEAFCGLGRLEEARDQLQQALQSMVKCVMLFEDFPHPATSAGSEYLAQLTARLGIRSLEECWQEITGRPLPQPVRDYVVRTGSVSES